MDSDTENVDQKSKNFGLSKVEFLNLQSELVRGNEEIFERVHLMHFEKCMKFLMANYRIDREESYDASMDAMLEFRKAILENKIQYGNLQFLYTRMAYYLFLKKKKRVKEYATDFADVELVMQDDSRELEREEQLVLLEGLISELPEDKRKFINDHFNKKMRLKEMAAIANVDETTFRKRKQRIVESLRKAFFQEKNTRND